MQFTIDFAEVWEYLCELPALAWLLIYLVLTWMITGGGLGYLNRDGKHPCDDVGFCLWIFAPIVIPLAVLIFGGWLLVVVLSCGYIPTPWKKLGEW